MYSPNILVSNGSAELSTTIKAQLAITRLKGVRLICGRMRDIGGEVYRPIEEVTIRYRINTISRNAPKGPSIERELIPRVNCYNNKARSSKESRCKWYLRRLTLELSGKAFMPISSSTVFCNTMKMVMMISPNSKIIATGYITFRNREDVCLCLSKSIKAQKVVVADAILPRICTVRINPKIHTYQAAFFGSPRLSNACPIRTATGRFGAAAGCWEPRARQAELGQTRLWTWGLESCTTFPSPAHA